jgi:hypothetical protein
VQPRCLPFYSASKAAQVITGTVCSVVEYVTDESISNAKVVFALISIEIIRHIPKSINLFITYSLGFLKLQTHPRA